MDASIPEVAQTSPEPAALPATRESSTANATAPREPSPPPRLWRGEAAIPKARRRPLWPALMALLMVALVGWFLVTWFKPARPLEFLPAWVLSTSTRPIRLASVAQGEQDRQAFMTPGRNAFAFASASTPRVEGMPDAVEFLSALDARSPDRAKVVYLSALATCEPADPSSVRILIDEIDAHHDLRAGWLPLHEILTRLADNPIMPLLLILDLRPIQIDPRLGLLGEDVAERVRSEVSRFKPFPGLILASCDSGEEPLASPALKRSAFSYYLEEGLRGWADSDGPDRRADGRVTVKELAAFVHDRVGRWASRTRGVRQTPTLLAGEVDDFTLVVLPRGKPQPHWTLPEQKELPTYPAWLLDGWKWRGELQSAGVDREAPRVFSQIEAALQTADIDWRGGVDEARVRGSLGDGLKALRARLETVRAIPRPRPISLAIEEAAGRTSDGVLDKALKELFAARPATDKKPAEAEAESSRAIAGFYAAPAAAKASDFDLARAAFRFVTEAREPDRDTVVFLDRLLRTRQPRPLYAETEVIRRLAALPASAWRPETVRLALDVTRRGELAASRSASLAWVRPMLDSANMLRHEGETILFEPGFAPVDEADRLLRRADTALAEVLSAGEAVERVRGLVETATVRLPATLGSVVAIPDMEGPWFEAARLARAIADSLLVPPPTDLSGARERVVLFERQAEALEAALALLSRPFDAQRIARLTALDAPVAPETYTAIADLLDTTFPDGPQRAALWSTLLSIDHHLNEEVFRLDAADGTRRLANPTSRTSEAEEPEGRSRVELPTRGAIEMLALAGLSTEELDPLRDSPVRVSRAWLDLPARLDRTTDLAKADRIGRLIPARVRSPRLDGPETNPARLVRVAEFQALRGWNAERFASKVRDLGGSPFDAEAAEELRAGESPTPVEVAVGIDPAFPALDPSHPVANIPLSFRLTTGPAETTAHVDVLTPDSEWLDIRRGSPWPSARSTFPAIEVSPLTFDLALSSPETTLVPLEVRLRPEADSPEGRPPVPMGFLVRSRLGGRTTHARVRLDVVPASQRLRVVLTTDPARPVSPISELRLRPVSGLPRYYLYIVNPTEADRPVLVQLLDGSARVPGCEATMTVKSHEFKRVAFGSPSAKPGDDFQEIQGPLRVRLLDASDPAKVLIETTLPVAVAPARDFLRVVEARFEPAGPGNEGKAGLRIRLRAVGPVLGPPCPVEMVLSPDRVPGLLNPGEGTFRAEITAEGDEILLLAEGLRFDEREDETGHVDLSVDGVPRAMILRATFARRGEPTTLRLDNRPAVRLRADTTVFTGAPFEVGIALDNPPPGGRLELTLGRFVAGRFQVDSSREGTAEKGVIRLNPRNAGDSLQFEATVRDPALSLEVRQVRGRRELRARLRDADGAVESEDTRAVVLDDKAPSGVKLVEVPKYALKGAPVQLRAVGAATVSGVRKVVMFVGRPVEGKLPPSAVTVEASPTDFTRTSWSARLPVPDDKKGTLDVSVQFVSGIGLSSFDTATVEVVESIPEEPGGIQGKVVEGTRPQSDLELVLLDSKGAEKGRAKTDGSGRFAFLKLPPGPYRLVCVKPTPPTRGVFNTVIAPGKQVEVTIEMLRTR